MRNRHRLVICLDGTWNDKDDSTNVLHHFGVTLAGVVPGDGNRQVTQTKYYLEGVGTGVLDQVTGGGFGFGLEENVRKAYDWLVENYSDNDEETGRDEIYIFGFSRGAYTARSLVGFISTCGLIRRGAPLSVNQLWDDYCVLGRKREHANSFWERRFGQSRARIRRINDLVLDPWNIKPIDKSDGLGGRVPGQLADRLNYAEALLVRWSRRVPITYLGIYDTVGAMGLDALAIPGLTSQLAMHHNMRPTSLIRHCRHALAIDEHRSNFAHTPFLQFVGHGSSDEDAQARTLGNANPREYWEHQGRQWRTRVEQRWFVGAHSNIGGGYPDNELASRALNWVLDGAKKAAAAEDGTGGLQCEEVALAPVSTVASYADSLQARDSYAEFVSPLWASVIRNKRHYRTIDPDGEARASSSTGKNGAIAPGYLLRSINERIDESVFEYLERSPAYNPPNLWEYARRRKNDPGCANDAERILRSRKEPKHQWLGETVTPHAVLVLWAALAAFGLYVLDMMFEAGASGLPLVVPAAAALLFPVVDWGESKASFLLACGRSGAPRRAFLDSIYWVRMLGLAFFLCGLAAAAVHLFALGWRAQSVVAAASAVLDVVKAWWFLPVLAGVGVVVANVLHFATNKRVASGIWGLVVGCAASVLAVVALVFAGHLVRLVLAPLGLQLPSAAGPVVAAAQFAGLLLLLQCGAIYFLDAFQWVGEPTARANLGWSITTLQKCRTASAVSRCLERMRAALQRAWDPADSDRTKGPAARAMRETLREALWRDIIGFIPLYSVVFAYGLWFASSPLKWGWLTREIAGVPWWLLIPLVAAAADWLEDACHLYYLRRHEAGLFAPDSPSGTVVPPLAFCFTVAKFIAFLLALLITAAAIAFGTYELAGLKESGWRGALALTISALAGLTLVVVALGALYAKWKNPKQVQTDSTAADRPDTSGSSQVAPAA